MKNFFISYSSEDGDFTRWLSRKFDNAGIVHWYDPMTGGFTPFTLIDEKLEHSSDMVVVVSEETLGSQRVFNELFSAILSGKPVVVVKMGDFSLPQAWENLLSGSQADIVDVEDVSGLDVFLGETHRSFRPRAEEKTLVDPGEQEGVFRRMEGGEEPVQFTTYHPKEVRPKAWYKLLTYVHLPGVADEVYEDSRKLLGDQARNFGRGRGQATETILRDAEITIVPEMPGFRFKPPRQVVFWMEDWHRADFRMLANPDDPQFELDSAVNGRVAFYVGPILVAETKIWAHVSENADQDLVEQPDTTVTADPYRDIFVSYSHDDAQIVEEIEEALTTLGDRMLRDVHDLRSGQKWEQALLDMIDQADIFQLFWSKTASESPYVEDEWRYALSLERPYFIRPLYWEDPMPDPPAELQGIQFDHYKIKN